MAVGGAGAGGDSGVDHMGHAIRSGPADHRRTGGSQAQQVDRLQPLAVRAARLQPHGLVLRLQIGQSQLFADLAGEAAFQGVVGQIFDVV
jgi:hypothetical protein